MSKANGDKSRHNRERGKKLERRVKMRALRATLGNNPAAAPAGRKTSPAAA